MWTRAELNEALPDYIRLAAGDELPDAHPVARQLANDGVDFAKVLQRVHGLSNATELERALTTSDIVDTTVSALTLRMPQRPSGVTEHRAVCRKVSLPNYKSTQFGEVSVSDSIEPAPDSADPHRVPEIDGTTQWVTGRARRYTLSMKLARTLWLNSDLDTMAMMMEQTRAALLRAEAKLFASYIESNPTLGDGSGLFIGANSVTGNLDVTGLGAALSKLRAQVNDVGALAAARGRILMVPAEHELSAMVLLSATCQCMDRFGFRLVVSPWLSAGAYYVFAPPDESPSILRLTLSGIDEPVFSTKRAFGFDAVGLHAEHATGFVAVSRLGCVKVTA